MISYSLSFVEKANDIVIVFVVRSKTKFPMFISAINLSKNSWNEKAKY